LVWPGGRAIAQLVDIPPRAADTKEPVVIVGAGSAEGAGSRGAVGGGANGTCVLALDTGMLRDVLACNRLSSAKAPAAPTAALAPRLSTARRLKSGMRAIMPWSFSGNGNAVPL
jgi:hypothetical protein